MKTHFPVDRMRAEATPFYYYDMELLDATIKAIRQYSDYPDFQVHYAVKANSNPEILRRIAASGLGADTVSIGEVKAALDAGFSAAKTVFAGVENRRGDCCGSRIRNRMFQC